MELTTPLCDKMRDCLPLSSCLIDACTALSHVPLQISVDVRYLLHIQPAIIKKKKYELRRLGTS